jgi:hypothetical protein
MHLTFKTKAITNVDFILIQNKFLARLCISLYANEELKTMNEKIKKGKLKRSHILPVLLEQGNRDADINLAAMLDMPLL